MDEIEKKAHLLRRFGLGSGHFAMKDVIAKTSAQVVDQMLNDQQIPEKFPVSFWEFAAQPDGKVESNSYVLGGWWALRMLMTQRPFQEKLTLFWHDHFAIQTEKVYEAPMVAGYLEVLRAKGRGKFRDLLKTVMKQGAMLMYLDGNISNRLHPNENLAREILELFTMGEGSGYTETDVKELSRALTGWTLHYMGLYTDEPYERTRDRAIKARMSINNFCFVPALHDNGQKTILGKSARFAGDNALDWICDQPQTARYICGKLWTWFAYPNPEPAVINALVEAWKKSDGDIRTVLATIVKRPEFWTDQAVSSMPKSPVDWYVSMYRSLNLAPILVALRGTPVSDLTPIRKELRDAGNGLHYLMGLQGQSLLNPPDVAGWEGGESWLTSDNFVRRVSSSDALFWGGGEERPMAVLVSNLIKAEFRPASAEDIASAFPKMFGLQVSDALRNTLSTTCEAAGGMKAFETKNGTANLFARLGRVAFAAPESQLC